MPRFLSTVLIFVGLVSVLAFENCGGAQQSQPPATAYPTAVAPVQVNGTVQKLNLDGCNFVICAVDNSDNQVKCFIPQGIDPALLNDGNVVTVNGVLRSDLLTTCMAGTVLQVTSAKLVTGTTAPPPVSPTPTP